MKLFIERLLEMFVVIIGYVIGFSLFMGGVILVTLLPNAVFTGVKVIFGIIVAISILLAIGTFINWLIIEPFFTKKGVDRK